MSIVYGKGKKSAAGPIRVAERMEPPRVGEAIRITVDLDEESHKKLKVFAAQQGVRIADLVRVWIANNCG
jgi:hypothetical protein